MERMALSQWSLPDDLHVCSLFGTGDYCGLDLLHECPFNGQDWQDFFVLPACQDLFQSSAHSCSELEEST